MAAQAIESTLRASAPDNQVIENKGVERNSGGGGEVGVSGIGNRVSGDRQIQAQVKTGRPQGSPG